MASLTGRLDKASMSFFVFYIVITFLTLFLIVNVQEQSQWASIYRDFSFISIILILLANSFGVKPILMNPSRDSFVKVGIGFALGLVMVSGLISKAPLFSLLSPLNTPILAVYGVAVIFLTSVVVATIEETLFRGVLFPYFAKILQSRKLAFTIFASVGLIFIFTTPYKIVGYASMLFGFVAYTTNLGKILGMGKNEWILATIMVSLMFGLFHYHSYSESLKTKYGGDVSGLDFELLKMIFSAFMFSVVACILTYQFRSITPSLIAHTLNNATVVTVMYNLPVSYALVMTALFGVFLMFIERR